MSAHRVAGALLVLAATIWGTDHARTRAAAQVPAIGSPDVEVLTRGPVHEAFGKPISFDPEPGVPIPQAPPSPIAEDPPAEQPDDPACVWIPGYWSWDDDQESFLWITGIWRIPPPGMVWVSGYWARTDEGWLWVSGFWQSASVEEIEYCPAPPASLETGPHESAPDADSVWAPGCWYYGESGFEWRPGYWMEGVPDWVWIPAHWEWTPVGCVFVDSYWDYPLERRGLLFAPVHFEPVVSSQPRYVYTPSIVIDAEGLLGNLFSRPRHHHYYFGDYYASGYDRRGIYPWFDFNRPHGWHDPLYSYERWRHRGEGTLWADRKRREYQYRREHPEARPPRTFQGQLNDARRPLPLERGTIVIGRPLTEIAGAPGGVGRIVPTDPRRRAEIEIEQKEQRNLREQRAKWEAEALKARPKNKIWQPVKPLELKPLVTKRLRPGPPPKPGEIGPPGPPPPPPAPPPFRPPRKAGKILPAPKTWETRRPPIPPTKSQDKGGGPPSRPTKGKQRRD